MKHSETFGPATIFILQHHWETIIDVQFTPHSTATPLNRRNATNKKMHQSSGRMRFEMVNHQPLPGDLRRSHSMSLTTSATDESHSWLCVGVSVHASECSQRQQPQINTNSHRYKSTVNLCSSASICGSTGHSQYDVNGYALACWRPSLGARCFARRLNRISHAARTLGLCNGCGSRMNWHVNPAANVTARRVGQRFHTESLPRQHGPLAISYALS